MLVSKDWTFQKLFSKIFVYNILFEDSEVDERFLGVDEDSAVLGISGAGCGIANHLSRHARSIDTVDINRHHLALTALKTAAAQNVASYDQFYELVGMGRTRDAERVIRETVATLPAWVQDYWKRRHRVFQKNMYATGLTARMIGAIRQIAGVDGDWVKSVEHETVPARVRRVEEDVLVLLKNPIIRRFLESPLQLLALGINFEQKKTIVNHQKMSFADFIGQHLRNMCSTDVSSNWFIWWALAGHFNHDHDDGKPPYLRKDHWERSVQAPTTVRYHNTNIFDVLGSAGPRTWSHYTLCDAIDWMPAPVQHRLLSEIVRTGRDGGVVLYRSVQTDSIVARHGLQDRLRLMEEETALATQLDRTRQYERVAFYRICN